MSDQIQTQIVLDGSQILQALGEIKETMGEIAKKAGLTEKEINEAFAAGTHNAEKYEKQLHETVVANQQLVNSTKKVDDASVAFKKAGDHVDSLTNKTKGAGTQFTKFAADAGKGVGGIKGLLAGGAKLMAGFFAVDKVIQFGKEVFNAAAKYQKYFTMLKVSLGSQREAAEAMGMLKDFAKSTPFELNELTESYIKFVNRGIRLTKQELTQLGDLAASQGKSFDQLTEAILDAGTGEFERLKEFGIKATQQGDKVTLMFKGQTVEVQKSESAIQQAIISMGAYNGIAGGMAEQSKTLGGQFSNLADSVSQFAASVGQKLAGAFSGGVGFLSDLFNGLTNLVKSNSLDDLRADFHSQIDATVDLNAKTLGLVKEYETLSEKATKLGGTTKLSKEEHERLDKVMGQIVDIVPDAATEFDKYGNVLGITTSKVYDFVQAQTDALKFKNKDLIENTKNTVKTIGNEIASISNKLNKGSKIQVSTDPTSGGVTTSEVALTAEEKRAMKERLDSLKAEHTQAKAFLNEISGDFIKQRQDQLEAEKKQRQKEQAEKDAAAKKTQAAQDAEKNAAKAKAAAEKAERERLQNIQQNLSLEKELNGARIEMLEAGKDKEIAIENERNRAAVADLAFRKMQADTVEEEIKLGKLEELEKQQHAKKLLEIERNYIAEQMKLREDATAQFIELTKEGRDLELAQADQQAKDQVGDIAAKYKKNSVQMLALIGAVQQQLQKKKADINQKYDKQDLDQQEQHDVLLAELTINNETARQVAVLQIKKHYAELALKQLTDSGKDENSVEVLNAKKLIQDLDGQLKEVGEKAGKGFSLKGVVTNIFKSFGANDTDAGAAADAAGQAMSSIMENMTSAISDGADRIIEERQRLIDSLDDQISAVEESLDKEKDLQQQGYANNVTIEQQKLDALKAQREKALKEEEEAQKKKANLQKLQVVLDSQAQVTNLITASTDIFASLSKIPFVGVPLAIGLIATMFGAFAAAKVNAFKLAGSTKFAEGDVIGGKSHSQGGNKYVSMDGNDPDIIEIEKGEFITKKKQTEKYLPLLRAINNDDLGGMSINELGQLAGFRIGETMNEAAKDDMIQTSRDAAAITVITTHDPEAREKLSNIEAHTKKLVQLKEEEETVRDMGDYFLAKKGSVTRRIYKSKP